jgi:hypothetical protein
MFTKRILRVLLIAIVALLVVNINPSSAEKLSLAPFPVPAVDPDDMGSAFTYQGRLMEGSVPADGQYDFQFRLFDDPTVGTQVSSTVVLPNQTVANGLFTVSLDFGAEAFPGFERWLEISVRPYSIDSEPYTTLLPRQEIAPAPYATFARTIYRRTVLIKPVTQSGSELDNGTVLRNALIGIIDASAGNSYLVKIEPGVYDLGDASLQMIPYVDLEGSGEGITLIKASGRDIDTTGTVIGSDHTEIRQLTIESVGYEGPGTYYDYAIGLYTTGTSDQKLSHVTILAHDAYTSSIGVVNHDSHLILDSVTLDVTLEYGIYGPYFGSSMIGIDNTAGAVTLFDSQVNSFGGNVSTGIGNMGGELDIQDSKIFTHAMSFIECDGVRSNGGNGVRIQDSLIEARGYAGISNDISNVIALTSHSSPLQIIDSSIFAEGDFSNVSGVLASSVFTNIIDNSSVEASGDFNSGMIKAFDALGSWSIRESDFNANGGTSAIGINFYGTENHLVEVSHTNIKADGGFSIIEPDPMVNPVIGVSILGLGVYTFDRVSIQVTEQTGTESIIGGVGILNDGANVTFENSKINRDTLFAYVGIYHLWYGSNTLRVNNSEIYTCTESVCHTTWQAGSGVGPGPVYIGSTLLWGGSVQGMAVCAFVHDENYAPFSGPACP